ncbi:hypothetical protein ACK3SF_00485 [Candidatus Nanosalina sp. VS9-1]|uniref:hypothetical protein n=1 Tax=Candidatus Nanosalina sp. VS9-1 TaxID=3388566 RepID=UPI0039E0AD89
MADKKFHRYLYDIENWIDEVVIAVLSFGAIFVATYVMFIAPGQISFLDLGNTLEPWITMLALMIIGRELWLIKNAMYQKWDIEEGE